VYSTVGAAAEAIGHDFTGARAQLWQKINGVDQAVSGFGEGVLEFDDGGFSIARSNTDGRYEVWLRQYAIDGKVSNRIPSDARIEGVRSVRLSGEAKALGGEHTLRVVFKNDASGSWVAKEELIRVATNAWTPFYFVVRISPAEECRMRIDDLDVTAPSRVQVR